MSESAWHEFIITDAIPRSSEPDSTEPASRVLGDLALELLERSPFGVVIQGTDGAIIDANQAACTVLHLTMDQLCGRTSMDPSWRAVDASGATLPGDQHPAMLALRSGAAHSQTMGINTPTNETAWIRVEAEPILGLDGQIVGVFTIFSDITSQRESNQSEREARLRFERITSEASDVLITTNEYGEVTYSTPSAHRVLLHDSADLIGEPIASIFPEMHRAAVADLITDVAGRPSQSAKINVPLPFSDGKQHWFQMRATNYLSDPTLNGILLAFINVDEQIRIEEELRKTNSALELRIAELHRTYEIDHVISLATELMLRCTTADEVNNVIWDCLVQAFESNRLALHVGARPSANSFAAASGNLSPQISSLNNSVFATFQNRGLDQKPLQSGECWAARTKRVHLNEKDGLQCQHALPEGCSVCVPFIVDGQIIAIGTIEHNGEGCASMAQSAKTVTHRLSPAIPLNALSTAN
jgi:PAS domain S-box-containing protein